MKAMENIRNITSWVVGGAVVLFAIAFFFAAQAFSGQGKYVEVKGLSERIVKSDVAIWSINFEVKSSNVDALYADINKNIGAIRAFFKSKGFEDSEVNIAPVNIYQDTYQGALFRYNASVPLSVYTKKVDLVRSASKETLDLVRQGVAINQNYITFQISDINSFKPEMLAEAIENAKTSAEQFAEASGASVSGISRGNQGVIDITEKDPGSPEYKKVRVVTTLRFLLK